MAKKNITGGVKLFQNAHLIDQVSAQVATNGAVIQEIPLEKLVIKENVRKEYKNISGLAESIASQDLIEPIIVKLIKGSLFEIICGHRRYKAYCLLKEKNPEKYMKIKAVVMAEETTEQKIREIQLVENIQREDISANDLKDALILFREQGLSNGEIADRLGKTEGFVHNAFSSIKMIERNPVINEIIQDNASVSFSDLQEVKSLPAEQQTQLLQAKADGDIKNKAELRERVRAQKGTAPAFFTEKGGVFRLRPIVYNPIKTSAEERSRMLDALRAIIKKLEEIHV